MRRMPLEKPIKLGPNSYYFHGDLWTAEEMMERWGVAIVPASATEEKTECAGRQVLSAV